MQRKYVASMLIWRHFYDMCPLGWHVNFLFAKKKQRMMNEKDFDFHFNDLQDLNEIL